MTRKIPVITFIASIATMVFLVIKKKTTAILRVNKELRQQISDGEERLAMSQDLYRHLFDNLLHGFIYCKAISAGGKVVDYTYVTVNKAYESITGLKSMAGKKVSELLPDFTVTNPEYFEALSRVVSGGEPETTEINLKSSGRWYSVSLYCPGDGYFVSLVDDITLKKTEENRLRLLESVITNATDAVLITEASPIDDPGPKIVFVNSAFSKMTGYTAEEVINKTQFIFQGPKSDVGELARMHKSMESSEACEIEIINYRKNGEEFYINMAVAPVFNKQGERTHFIAIERDVTERLKNIQAIKDQNGKLRDIAWTQSHEVRGPLARIRGIVNLMNNHSDSKREKSEAELIRHLSSSAAELDEVIDTIVRKTEEIDTAELRHDPVV